MATIKFYLHPREKKDGTHALKLAVHMNRTTQRKDIGIEIPKKLWSEAKQQILGDYNGITKLALNNALSKHLINANEKLFEITQSGELASMTAKQFCLKLYNSCPTPVKQHSFHSFFKEYIQRLFEIGKIGSAKAYEYALKSFKRFYPDEMPFDEVNYLLIKKLDENLIKRGISKNGRASIHRHIRALYNYAAKELDYVSKNSNPYLDFQILTDDPKKRYLELEEVRSIYNYKGEYQKARDLFIFQVFCVGIDIVDMCYLTHDNIEKGRLIYNRRKVTKTTRKISVKITPEIQALIDKYKTQNYLFPFLQGCTSVKERYLKHTNARRMYNNHLNKIGQELEFDKALTSKVSRHSWATIAKKLGMAKDMISEMLGHKAAGVAVTDYYLGDYDVDVKDDWNKRIIDAVSI